MNEKKLKKEIVEIFKKYKSVEDIGTRLIMLGFQKGKLEQKKEDNNILIKYSKLRLYRSKSCQLLIKQLQKEIGGNEK